MESMKLCRYFIYIIQDTTVIDPIVYQVGNESVDIKYKPIYIGRGCNKRDMSHLSESHNPRVNKIVKQGHTKIEKVLTNLSWVESVTFEQELIYRIGRLDLEQGPLFNATGGIYWNEDKRPGKPGPLNLELNKIKLILDSLNKFHSRKLAVAALGISERTIFRMLKDYNIQKTKIAVKNYYYWQL